MILLEREDKSAVIDKSGIGRLISGLEKDLHQGLSPLGAVDIVQLLEHNLHLLPIGGALSNKVETLNHTISLRPFRYMY